jgi:hypothetical protein
MKGELNIQDMILAIRDIKSECKLSDQSADIDYEKFYNMVMGLTALTERVNSSGGGGTMG